MPEPAIERTLDVGPEASVTIENRSGRTAVQGWDRAEVRVLATVRNPGLLPDVEPYLEEVAAGIHRVGHDVYIEAPSSRDYMGLLGLFGARPRVDYDVWMPRGGSLKVESRSGSIKVEEIGGQVEMSSRSGSLEATRLGRDLRAGSRSGSVRVAEVKGDVFARSASGSVRVTDAGGDVEASSASGSVELRDIGGDIRASSASGSLRLWGCRGRARLNGVSGSCEVAAVGGDLRARTVSGHLQAERCDGPIDLSSVSGSIVYRGAIGGDSALSSVSGSIRLVVPPSSLFVIDAQSRSGSISSDLPVRSPEAAAGAKSPPPVVKVRTVRGSIRLAQDVGGAP